MSTRCSIGIKEGNVVKSVYCHKGGMFSDTGVLLDMFYKDADKVRQLVSLGALSCLGYNLESPPSFRSASQMIRLDIFTYSFIHTKTTFTHAYYRDNQDETEIEIRQSNVVDFFRKGEEFNYLFDVEKNKWYTGFVRKNAKGEYKIDAYDLHKILTDETYFNKFFSKYNIDDDFKAIKDKTAMIKADLKVKVLDKYNAVLRKNGINDVVIAYVNNSKGERVYGVLEKTPKNIRRKVLYRSASLSDVCTRIFLAYKGSEHLYFDKLTLAETINLFANNENAIPLF